MEDLEYTEPLPPAAEAPAEEAAVPAVEEQAEACPEEEPKEPPATVIVTDVQFRPGQKVYFFDPDGMTFAAGDHVIMDTARGEEYGTVTAGNHAVPLKDIVAPLRKILRPASARDEHINAENRAKEKRAFELCLQKVAQHGLDMQTVSAECAFDGSKILFYFTADERVDFRELVKDLAAVFHTRIELRQIGVRDKARMVGGLGICGRPFCCATFLPDFQPVSIKMAKTQNLSLNPTKISGTCGRLMCCLKYEQDTYEDLLRTSPRVDSLVDTPDGRGTVIDSEPLRQRVRVRLESAPDTVNYYANEDIAVLRSGRGKKTDPPIPADLAPISGSGRQPRRSSEKTEAAPVLDAIRFKYSTESIAEEKESTPAEPSPAVTQQAESTAAPRENQENRRRRDREQQPRRREESGEGKPRQNTANQRPPRKPRPEQGENTQAAPAPKEAAADKPQNSRQSGRNRPPRKPRPEQTAPEGAPQEAGQTPQSAGGTQQPRQPGRNRPPRKPRPDRAEHPEQSAGDHQQARREAPEAPASAEGGGQNRRSNNFHHRRRPHGPRPGGGDAGPKADS